MPVDSHPLSPADAPPTSRNTRHRATRTTEADPPRPVTSYFALKSQSDERAAASVTVSSSGAVDANDTVKANSRRPRLNPFGSSFRAPSTSPERKSVVEAASTAPRIALTNGNAREDRVSYSTSGPSRVKTPGMTPRAHSPALKFLAASADTLPAPAVAIAVSTQWHTITEEEMDDTMTKINDALPTPESHQHIYRSTLRLLSRQLESLDTLQAQIELNKRHDAIRRRKIASMMEILPPSEVATLRTVLDILSQEHFDESPIEGPQLVVSDSLTEAIAEALVPLGIPSPAVTPNSTLRRDDAASIASSARGTDRDTLESASVRSRSSRKSRDARNRPGSVIEEWMGGWWRDKDRSTVASSVHSGDSDHDRPPSPGAGDETEIDTRPRRKASGGLRVFSSLGVPSSWMGSSTPPAPPTVAAPAPSPERRREPKRKLSVAISTSAASIGSPATPHFQPPPAHVVAPTIAPQISTPPDMSPAASTRISVLPAEDIPPLPSGPHPSHIKAISYATRVMTSDHNSILHDGGLNVSPLVAELAYTLVCNLKADLDFSLREREGRTEQRSVTPQSPAMPYSPDVPNPALAVAQMEPTESRATIVSNLSRTLNNSMLAGASRRTASIAITGPLLFGFKQRATPAIEHGIKSGPKPGPSSSNAAAAQNGPQLSVVNGTAPKTGTVELDSIIPAESRPPTLYLSRTYTSYIADPSFRPAAFPSAPSRFSVKLGGSSRSLETQTDRFGFIYDACVYDVNLLARAREVSNTAPACLTGVKIADREVETEEEDWWPSHEGELPPSKKSQLKVIPEPCGCQDGVLPAVSGAQHAAEPKADEGALQTLKVASAAGGESSIPDSQVLLKENGTESSGKEVSGAVEPSPEETSTKIPSHVCFTTVRVLLLELKTIHDRKQKAQQAEWDPFLRRVRRIKESSSKQGGGTQTVLAQASSGAAAFLGLSKPNEDREPEDDEASWTTGLGLTHLSANKEEWKDFTRLIRDGIPLVYRSKVWFECSGATELSEPGLFRDLLLEARGIDERVKRGERRHVAMEEIEKDVTRTMPLNIFFGGDGQGVDKLRAVLGAYSLRNPAVGYCQGMNLVASTLLLVLADQHEAFWVFCAIIEKILPPDFFSPSLLVSRACPMVLLDYVQDYLPKLFAHLATVGIDLPAVCFSWFLSLFTDCLPVETLFRVWDMFICDKNGMDVLFRISLAILKTGEEDLLQCSSMSSLYSVLESLPTKMWDADRLLKAEAELRSVILHDDILKRRAIHVEALSQRS